MEGRITICMFLLLILVYIAQAAPRTNNKSGINNVNSNSDEAVTENDINSNGSLYEIENNADVETNLYKYVNNNTPEDVLQEESANGAEDYGEPRNNVNPSTAIVGPKKRRSYAVGDTFTPQEMLIIASCLYNKVYPEMAGRGKGIVSSARNAYELADRMFEAFFLTFKRIVVIREADIGGLDAIQALALCGKVVDNLRSSLDSYTESPVKFQGDYTEDLPQKCHYKVLWKEIEDNTNNTRRQPRRKFGQKIMKKLGQNRKLVVNPKRRGIEHRKKYNRPNKKGVRKTEKGIKEMAPRTKNPKPVPKRFNKKSVRATENKKSAGKTRMQQLKAENWKMSSKSVLKNDFKGNDRLRNGTIDKLQNETEKTGTVCRWRYACASPGNLYTCRLHSVCRTDNTSDKYVKQEQTENSRRFRRIVGLHIIDEELEKIFENHVYALRPQNMNFEDKRIESLAEYFNSIVASGLQTTPMTPNVDSPLSNDENNINDSGPSADSFKSDVTGNQEYIMVEDEDAQAKRILGLKPEVPYNVIPRNKQ